MELGLKSLQCVVDVHKNVVLEGVSFGETEVCFVVPMSIRTYPQKLCDRSVLLLTEVSL